MTTPRATLAIRPPPASAVVIAKAATSDGKRVPAARARPGPQATRTRVTFAMPRCVARQIDRKRGMNASGIGRENHDPCGKKDGLGDRVGHEYRGPFPFLTQAQQLFVQPVA